MRRFAITIAVVVTALVTLALTGCTDARKDARGKFVEQLQAEGGLPQEMAECVVDRFFEDRTTQELREFFERKDLTEAERAEFQQLGDECAPDTTGS
jgi:predicted transcriptional regulator